MKFINANQAFEYYYNSISDNGEYFDNTKTLFNIGFYIINPLDNIIDSDFRNWSSSYALSEWHWYLSRDNRISKLGEIYGKVPAIWKRMADDKGRVNSNYGWQWGRNNQLDKVIDKLKSNKNTRQATISIYDGKEIDNYKNDTPCTYAVQFDIINNKLCMSVFMRSNDLWYGFCNDQFQFSELQALVAKELDLDLGWYYHFAHNLHLYNDKLNKNV